MRRERADRVANPHDPDRGQSCVSRRPCPVVFPAARDSALGFSRWTLGSRPWCVLSYQETGCRAEWRPADDPLVLLLPTGVTSAGGPSDRLLVPLLPLVCLLSVLGWRCLSPISPSRGWSGRHPAGHTTPCKHTPSSLGSGPPVAMNCWRVCVRACVCVVSVWKS